MGKYSYNGQLPKNKQRQLLIHGTAWVKLLIHVTARVNLKIIIQSE